ncbi:hypothetical protein ACFX2I_003422 [Malus domestica]|uniref:F-box protein SKIP22-like n=1 Tax=Malus domestica TaxID=3750 RepID=UPI0010A9DDBC|nr:F-box protein SKIP22-like [Malus domestica]
MENNNEPAAGSGGRTWEKYSVPFFLKRVLREELGEDRSNHKLLEISVHAVLLDSGFVRLDLVQGMRANQVSYTVPQILQHQGNNGNRVEAVVLEFRKWRQFMNVYGSFASGGSTCYRLRMDNKRFAPVIESVWENRNMNERDELVLEKEVLEFWRIVKDGIAMPLLIDLCTKVGLSAPSSLMCLPMKILESLRGVAIAKVGRVCKELRNLASNDELWKKKYAEEFGDCIAALPAPAAGDGSRAEDIIKRRKYCN